MRESEYHKIVEDVLNNHFGEKAVRHEVYIQEYGRFADFVVYTPLVTLVIEVENHAHEFIDGVGQAVLYKSLTPMSQGMVITPPTVSEDVLKEIEKISAIVPVAFVNDNV